MKTWFSIKIGTLQMINLIGIVPQGHFWQGCDIGALHSILCFSTDQWHGQKTLNGPFMPMLGAVPLSSKSGFILNLIQTYGNTFTKTYVKTALSWHVFSI